ncbi:MAG: DUF1254 domain-containing protein [Devosia sp.]|jgi:uncharacterized membrane protein|uniref:DUF1254 domain-containing protein n=1 Tax=Devosia sp. 66-22 TaxID=1895753 RepID=UPI0009271015|nr:DUF1254 domain-containing protein [Devosia sp. 66-22]MBN9345430.1 DUF1254 domain-containing protein [Devosia sp.]OJX51448.1 MAG: hypothetical protein BGO81_12320 [Devosia sp. 66-22]
MVRTLLYLLGGLLLGLVIHLVVILILPRISENAAYTQVASIEALNRTTLLALPKAGEANPLHLDPDMSYGLCKLDLSAGPGEVTGTLPLAFWSVAVYDSTGTVLYSTTNRDGIGQTLDLGIFDPAQTRLLAEQKIDISPGLLIVEARTDEVFVVVRLAPPHPSVRDRYEAQLERLACRNIAI